jgi:hypothetical protein
MVDYDKNIKREWNGHTWCDRKQRNRCYICKLLIDNDKIPRVPIPTYHGDYRYICGMCIKKLAKLITKEDIDAISKWHRKMVAEKI